nr:hypothetical protein [Tanacetum cinerariifolium]
SCSNVVAFACVILRLLLEGYAYPSICVIDWIERVRLPSICVVIRADGYAYPDLDPVWGIKIVRDCGFDSDLGHHSRLFEFSPLSRCDITGGKNQTPPREINEVSPMEKRWIRHIRNCEYVFSCEDMALIHRISFPGYDVLGEECGFDSKEDEVVPKVDDVSLVDGVFNGAFGGDRDEYFPIGDCV